MNNQTVQPEDQLLFSTSFLLEQSQALLNLDFPDEHEHRGIK
jgi:hypothetical protein